MATENGMTTMTEEQEAEVRAPDAQREEIITRSSKLRQLHPALLAWLASTAKYAEQPGLRGDLVRSPEAHPDVVQIRKDFPQMSLETATKMAWLCWRARQVQFWTRDLNRDTYRKVDGLTVLVHRGVDRHTWAEALEHADLRDEVHDQAMERRSKFYTAQEQRREEEEAIALTMRGLPTDPNAGRGADLVPSEPIAPQDKAQAQAAANVAAGFGKTASGRRRGGK